MLLVTWRGFGAPHTVLHACNCARASTARSFEWHAVRGWRHSLPGTFHDLRLSLVRLPVFSTVGLYDLSTTYRKGCEPVLYLQPVVGYCRNILALKRACYLRAASSCWDTRALDTAHLRSGISYDVSE